MKYHQIVRFERDAVNENKLFMWRETTLPGVGMERKWEWVCRSRPLDFTTFYRGHTDYAFSKVRRARG